MAVEAVRRCASGALAYSVDGMERHEPPAPPSITVTRDGPYAVAGPVDWSIPPGAGCRAGTPYALPLQGVAEQAVLRRLPLGAGLHDPA